MPTQARMGLDQIHQMMQSGEVHELKLIIKADVQGSIEALVKALTDLSTDKVKVNYRGTLVNGTEFDSSYKRNQPAEFPLNGVIKCWTEGVQKMKVGGKSVLVCPSDLAYGEQGRPSIPGNAALIFEIELLEIAPPTANGKQ